MLNDTEKLSYWMDLIDEDLHPFTDRLKVKDILVSILDSGMLRYYELPEQKGIVVYVITDNFRGSDCVNEILMYIKKEHRGNLRLFKQLIDHLEQAGRANNCTSVKIASNIGYNDESVLKCLQRFGYKTDVVSKEI